MVSGAVENGLVRWIPLLPLLAALLHGVLLALVRRSLARSFVIGISCGAVGLSFVLTCIAFASLIGTPGDAYLHDVIYTWMGVGVGDAVFSADLAFQFDPLSAVMCLVVTGVGALIHVYSVGYMDEDHRDDRGFQRFFCYLNLFIAAMLVLVLGDNLLLMFLGWEGVGLCSYLLIGFWYSDEWNAYCGSKAFIVNRIGDFGFLVGMLLLFWSLADAGVAAISFRGIEAGFDRIAGQSVAVPELLGGQWSLPTLIGLCFLLGAAGKSAQLPLYVWLPDAMAGPTPVSALIHAATMVTAGVYLVCRLSFIYAVADGASTLIAWVGGLTALFAATIALVQTDIKKVLAYSTVSQLGYMFLAAGCGAYTVAMFHVVTHAFFKALLFMGAGAVIVAMHHEQDMLRMGNLKKKLKQTKRLMWVGVLAIAGVPPLSGFFSKDEILTSAFASHVPGHVVLYGMGLLTAVLTAFYMGRLQLLTFYGESRVKPELLQRIEEPGPWILQPLYVLAVLSFCGGIIGVPQIWGDLMGLPPDFDSDSLGNWLTGSLVATPEHDISRAVEWLLVGVAVVASAAGLGLAYLLYERRPELSERAAKALRPLHTLLDRKYWVDELYDVVLVRPLVAISDRVLFRVIDSGIIDGVAINGTAWSVRNFALFGLRRLQSGMVQGYLLAMVVGALAVIGWLVR